LLQSATSEDKCVSWSMGKAVIEDDSVEHVLLGDYMAIMGGCFCFFFERKSNGFFQL